MRTVISCVLLLWTAGLSVLAELTDNTDKFSMNESHWGVPDELPIPPGALNNTGQIAMHVPDSLNNLNGSLVVTKSTNNTGQIFMNEADGRKLDECRRSIRSCINTTSVVDIRITEETTCDSLESAGYCLRGISRICMSEVSVRIGYLNAREKLNKLDPSPGPDCEARLRRSLYPNTTDQCELGKQQCTSVIVDEHYETYGNGNETSMWDLAHLCSALPFYIQCVMRRKDVCTEAEMARTKLPLLRELSLRQVSLKENDNKCAAVQETLGGFGDDEHEETGRSVEDTDEMSEDMCDEGKMACMANSVEVRSKDCSVMQGKLDCFIAIAKQGCLSRVDLVWLKFKLLKDHELSRNDCHIPHAIEVLPPEDPNCKYPLGECLANYRLALVAVDEMSDRKQRSCSLMDMADEFEKCVSAIIICKVNETAVRKSYLSALKNSETIFCAEGDRFAGTLAAVSGAPGVPNNLILAVIAEAFVALLVRLVWV